MVATVVPGCVTAGLRGLEPPRTSLSASVDQHRKDRQDDCDGDQRIVPRLSSRLLAYRPSPQRPVVRLPVGIRRDREH